MKDIDDDAIFLLKKEVEEQNGFFTESTHQL